MLTVYLCKPYTTEITCLCEISSRPRKIQECFLESTVAGIQKKYSHQNGEGGFNFTLESGTEIILTLTLFLLLVFLIIGCLCYKLSSCVQVSLLEAEYPSWFMFIQS
ncbi:uncharacterized protein LOC111695108 [Eurytemora carolleeae]|uniref:uncharacterized protein LOC111695108 n=1 Tax=Eurytemora carolleeae TaxID=1294199 RepID=UPI000C76C93D|nr:uncharacterized protein LOC111695108 [Eurytemora carolleeae]|eukprot:XP_023320066.1 uncharacterized protein LOC111695108 [Eurytemora affinis]